MINRLLLICEREYLTRVRKRSFLLMTILTPLLIILFYGVIIYININPSIIDQKKTILVQDRTDMIANKLENQQMIEFVLVSNDAENTYQLLNETKATALLSLEITANNNIQARLFSIETPSAGLAENIGDKLEQIIRNQKMMDLGFDIRLIDSLQRIQIPVDAMKVSATGSTEANVLTPTVIAIISSLLIYFFIFLYGVQVMRGVIEEKSNRIVEVIISSVRPFELMMGKILGIVLVGLTQFVIWVILIVVLGSLASSFLTDMMPDATTTLQNGDSKISRLTSGFASFDIKYMLLTFLFYFAGGYLFYAALFAAVGSAVDNETDTQQFILPITLPLVLSIVLSQSLIFNNPHGELAVWLSIIPLTSPITMMCRIPFGVPVWQLALSISAMIIGILLVTWLASRIYRVGILMYGKKANYKELAKWIFYK
jgi:ABC-2 type transport system permease protein